MLLIVVFSDHHNFLLKKLYESFTGVTFPTKKVHIRTQLMLLEGLYAGWTKIRHKALPLLQRMHGRPDAAMLVTLCEDKLPLTLLAYDMFFKETTGNLCLTVLCKSLEMAILTQRKNYRAALAYNLDQLLYLIHVKHPLRELLIEHMNQTDEAILEGGINALLRGFIEGIVDAKRARDVALLGMAIRINKTPMTESLRSASVKENKGQFANHKLEKLLAAACVMLSNLVAAIVNATEANMPEKVKVTKNYTSWRVLLI